MMGNPRAGNPDHKRDRNMPAPENEVITARMEELLTPLVYNQLSYYQQLGLRDRILGLPLMVAAVVRDWECLMGALSYLDLRQCYQ
jgi:hypothetical protein